jgi:hypothetical protein
MFRAVPFFTARNNQYGHTVSAKRLLELAAGGQLNHMVLQTQFVCEASSCKHNTTHGTETVDYDAAPLLH